MKNIVVNKIKIINYKNIKVMTEKKTVLSSERIAIRLAEIKENKYISYYDLLIKIDCIVVLLLMIFGIFFFEVNSILHTLSYLVPSIVFLLIFREIHVKTIESLKVLKEEVRDIEFKQNNYNDDVEK